MKRSQRNNVMLPSMRKNAALKTLGVAMAAIAMTGCNDTDEAKSSLVSECESLGLEVDECQAAYKDALAQAAKEHADELSSSELACELASGGRCGRDSATGLWVPFVTGYLFSSLYSSPRYVERVERIYVQPNGSYSSTPSAKSYQSNTTSSTASKPKPAPVQKAPASTASKGGWGSFSSMRSSSSGFGG